LQLTNTQKQALYTDGFVKLPAIVPTEAVHTALRTINASLGTLGIDPKQLDVFRTQSYCPELRDTAAITDLLYNSPLWNIAESAIGSGAIRAATHGQIALRFPSLQELGPASPHLDGMHYANNGVPANTIWNFTALVGIFLSDIPREFMGNLSVWPGTHRLYEEYFREHGPQSLLQGMPPVTLPEPVQITAQAGDAVLCHYQLAHGITINVSPFTRYAIFFRLEHVEHEALRWECMTDIWREWAGMQGI
jgi:Phytanoyl-CoA dioxygenase (PhyH)